MKCTCKGRKEAMRKGVDSLIKEEAPLHIINDYVTDMESGQWVNCTCDAGNEE